MKYNVKTPEYMRDRNLWSGYAWKWEYFFKSLFFGYDYVTVLTVAA